MRWKEIVEEQFGSDRCLREKNAKKVGVQRSVQDSMTVLKELNGNVFVMDLKFYFRLSELPVQIMFQLVMDSNLMMYERSIRINGTKTID